MASFIIKDLSLVDQEESRLDRVSFTHPLGESLLVVGESGSGKTLLTKALIGIIPRNMKQTGSIHYGDLHLDSFSDKDWNAFRGQKIAYLVQNPMSMFNPFQTIWTHFYETIKSHSTLSKSECYKKALDVLEKVRIANPEAVLHQYSFELSGGMLQRIMLGIILCLDPETIILDEPTSAVDRVNREMILSLIKDLLAQHKTVITVTHDYYLARELGGNMLVLEKGKVVEFGKTEDLLTAPKESYTKELFLEQDLKQVIRNNAGM